MLRTVWSAAGEVVIRSHGLLVSQADASLGGEDQNVFVVLTLRQRLITLGAGGDARSLAQMPSLFGWSITLVDRRPQLARAERFPQAKQVLTIRAGCPSPLANHSPGIGCACGGLISPFTKGDIMIQWQLVEPPTVTKGQWVDISMSFLAEQPLIPMPPLLMREVFGANSTNARRSEVLR